MARYVLKFGGTSVGNVDRIQHAANIVTELAQQGHEIVVVVSAMAGMTNQLIGYTNTFNSSASSPEHDVVTASGEQITAGLMALALQKCGLKAQSFLAFQIAIQTNDMHGDATITNIETNTFETHFANKSIPVVAGFQGITENNRVTTLGRGGSDTTAVALAAALNADCCYIYTDVEGVYTADPRIAQNAYKIDMINYSHMLELAKHGAKVLHARCVELGMAHNVNLYVLSSFVKATGTHIISDAHIVTQKNFTSAICGIAHSLSEVYVSLKSAPSHLSMIIKDLEKNNINVDMPARNIDTQLEQFNDTPKIISFTVNKNNFEQVKSRLEAYKTANSLDILAIDPNIVKISIIGAGMNHQTIKPLVFDILTNNQIPVHFAYQSDIKLSLVIANDQMTKAIGVLHDALILTNK